MDIDITDIMSAFWITKVADYSFESITLATAPFKFTHWEFEMIIEFDSETITSSVLESFQDTNQIRRKFFIT